MMDAYGKTMLCVAITAGTIVLTFGVLIGVLF